MCLGDIGIESLLVGNVKTTKIWLVSNKIKQSSGEKFEALVSEPGFLHVSYSYGRELSKISVFNRGSIGAL